MSPCGYDKGRIKFTFTNLRTSVDKPDWTFKGFSLLCDLYLFESP